VLAGCGTAGPRSLLSPQTEEHERSHAQRRAGASLTPTILVAGILWKIGRFMALLFEQHF
jgi:hypothetical protein